MQKNMENMIKDMKNGWIAATVLELLQANNTITTLEVKTSLRTNYPDFSWTQPMVSDYMNEMHLKGDLTYEDNGTYRIYSGETKKVRASKKVNGKTLKKVKVKKISKTKALDLMMNNKGHFFTAEFTKKNGDLRVMNCQVTDKDQDTKLGYVTVKEAALMRTDPKNAHRKINLQTLKALKIGGVAYKVN